jgi:hypothetical protein
VKHQALDPKQLSTDEDEEEDKDEERAGSSPSTCGRTGRAGAGIDRGCHAGHVEVAESRRNSIVSGEELSMIYRHNTPPMKDPANHPPGAPKGRGCLLYGCLTLVVVMVAVGIGGFFLARYGLERLTAFVEEYTDTVPMAIESIRVEPGEFEELERRMTAFQDALDRGARVDPLILSGHDLNVLIARHSDLEMWRDRAHVQVVGDQIVGQISLPLDDLAEVPGLKRLKGRYLNGTAALKVSLRNSRLQVNLDSLEVKGKPIPEEVMRSLRQQNLAQDADQNPDLAETLGQLRSIEVVDGQIVIRAAGSD